MATIPTVKVHSSDPKSQGPYVIINETDFDPKKHKKYEDEEDKARAKEAASAAAETETKSTKDEDAPLTSAADEAAPSKAAHKPKFGAKH